VDAVRPLEELEVLEGRARERLEPDDEASGIGPASTGRLGRPKWGSPPSDATRFATLQRCVISSSATDVRTRRKRATASA
jgi:hypothetical protein